MHSMTLLPSFPIQALVFCLAAETQSFTETELLSAVQKDTHFHVVALLESHPANKKILKEFALNNNIVELDLHSSTRLPLRHMGVLKKRSMQSEG